MGAMVTVFAPDGTQGQVPQGRVRDAIAAGGQLGLQITAPDGTQGYVPANRFNDAIQAGGKAAVAGGTPPPVASAPLPSGLQSKVPTSDNPIQRSFDEQTASDPQYGAVQNIGKSIVRSVGTPFVHPLDTLKALATSIPAVAAANPQAAIDANPIVSTVRSVASDYKNGGAGYAASNLGGSLVGQALLGAVGGEAIKSLTESTPTVPGENYTSSNLAAHTGILGRMNGLGDNFIPQQASADTLSTIRQAAADNPAITQTALKSGSTPQNIAAFQSILQKANSALEAPHAATLAQYANTPADVSSVQAAVGSQLPQTLAGVAPEDASAIQELQQRLGTVNTLGGLNDLRQWLNNEASAGYKQDGVAAARGTATKAGIRSAADAARNAYYDQMQQASGTDFGPIKAQQSALLDQQEGAAKLGQTLSAQQAVADEPKNLPTRAAEVVTGGRALKAGPVAGTGQLIAEKVLGRTPLTQPNYLIREMLGDLPYPTQPPTTTGVAAPPSSVAASPQVGGNPSPQIAPPPSIVPSPQPVPTTSTFNPQTALPPSAPQMQLPQGSIARLLTDSASPDNPQTPYPQLNTNAARTVVQPNPANPQLGPLGRRLIVGPDGTVEPEPYPLQSPFQRVMNAADNATAARLKKAGKK